MKIILLALSTLIPFAENPRKAGKEDHDALIASIQAFGLFKPMLIWRGNDHPKGVKGPIVIGGNQRLISLQKMEIAGRLPLQIPLTDGKISIVDAQAIPCIEFQGSWAQAKVVALRDNSQEGEWDWDTLPNYMKDLEALFPNGDFDFTLTGFDEQTLKDLDALATDPLVGLDKIGGDGSDPLPPAPAGGTSPAPDANSALTRQGAKVVIGNIRGKIPVALYERLATLIKKYAARLDTTDLTLILARVVDDLEKKMGTDIHQPPGKTEPKPKTPRTPRKKKGEA